MIQTHYVPLAPPYRIIYTGGKMGLQIGTLIVVIHDEETSSGRQIPRAFTQTVTLTHPVVSYVNKENCIENNYLVSDLMYGGTFSEAVVWDQVEQKDVATLCLVGQKIIWDDFLNILTPLIAGCRDEDVTRDNLIEARHFVLNLEELGGSIEIPDGHESMTNYFGEEDAVEFQILLERMPYDVEGGDSKEICICSEYGAELPFVARTEDPELAFKILRRQKWFYKRLLLNLLHTKPVRIYFEVGGCCEDEADAEVTALVEKLNSLG